MTFAPGDTVQLKSGGALMTIDTVSTNGREVCCVWHDETKRLQRNWIALVALQKAETLRIRWPDPVFGLGPAPLPTVSTARN